MIDHNELRNFLNLDPTVPSIWAVELAKQVKQKYDIEMADKGLSSRFPPFSQSNFDFLKGVFEKKLGDIAVGGVNSPRLEPGFLWKAPNPDFSDLNRLEDQAYMAGGKRWESINQEFFDRRINEIVAKEIDGALAFHKQTNVANSPMLPKEQAERVCISWEAKGAYATDNNSRRVAIMGNVQARQDAIKKSNMEKKAAAPTAEAKKEFTMENITAKGHAPPAVTGAGSIPATAKEVVDIKKELDSFDKMLKEVEKALNDAGIEHTIKLAPIAKPLTIGDLLESFTEGYGTKAGPAVTASTPLITEAMKGTLAEKGVKFSEKYKPTNSELALISGITQYLDENTGFPIQAEIAQSPDLNLSVNNRNRLHDALSQVLDLLAEGTYEVVEGGIPRSVMKAAVTHPDGWEIIDPALMEKNVAVLEKLLAKEAATFLEKKLKDELEGKSAKAEEEVDSEELELEPWIEFAPEDDYELEVADAPAVHEPFFKGKTSMAILDADKTRAWMGALNPQQRAALAYELGEAAFPSMPAGNRKILSNLILDKLDSIGQGGKVYINPGEKFFNAAAEDSRWQPIDSESFDVTFPNVLNTNLRTKLSQYENRGASSFPAIARPAPVVAPAPAVAVPTPMPSFKESTMPQNTTPASKPTVGQRLMADVDKAAWFIAAGELTDVAQGAVSAALQRNLAPEDEAMRAKIGQFLETDLGRVIVGMALSAMLDSSAPMAAKYLNISEDQVQFVASQLRFNTFATGGKKLVDEFAGPILEVAKEALRNMPQLPAPSVDAPSNETAQVSEGAEA